MKTLIEQVKESIKNKPPGAIYSAFTITVYLSENKSRKYTFNYGDGRNIIQSATYINNECSHYQCKLYDGISYNTNFWNAIKRVQKIINKHENK